LCRRAGSGKQTHEPGDHLSTCPSDLAWQSDAVCREPEYAESVFFAGYGERPGAAREVSSRCAVRVECLEYTVAHDGADGV
jgi:hypothetical protein